LDNNDGFKRIFRNEISVIITQLKIGQIAALSVFSLPYASHNLPTFSVAAHLSLIQGGEMSGQLFIEYQCPGSLTSSKRSLNYQHFPKFNDS
jgi:hypothetical protein